MTSPTAAILIIGNEVLSGRTADVNINHLARRLADIGVPVKEARIVPDVESEIVEALKALRAKYGYVFTTGGIGPTHDDITIAAVAKAFGVKVERNARVEEFLRSHHGNRATEATFRMADYPVGAELVWHVGEWQPACRMQNVFVLAGIPRSMQVMLEACLPLLQQGDPIHTRSVDVWARESEVAATLEAIQQRFETVEVGSYPYRVENRPGTALVVRGTDATAVNGAYQAILEMIDDLGVEQRAA